MKLEEIKTLFESQFLTDKQDIKEWLDKHAYVSSGGLRVFINPDGVTLHAPFRIIRIGKNTILNGKNHLPIKFEDITASKFELDGVRISSLEGMPETIAGDFNISNCHLDNLKFLPKEIEGKLIISDCTLSLKGIAEYMGKVKGEFLIRNCDIVDGGIGLVLCDGLKGGFKLEGNLKQTTAFMIIIKFFMGKPDEIFKCQDELIASGFDKYAEF